jgi:hypothetical protein
MPTDKGHGDNDITTEAQYEAKKIMDKIILI